MIHWLEEFRLCSFEKKKEDAARGEEIVGQFASAHAPFRRMSETTERTTCHETKTEH